MADSDNSPPPFQFNFTEPDEDYGKDDTDYSEAIDDTTKIVNTDPYVFLWTIGINLFSLVFAYCFVLTTRQRRGFFRRVYFPRILKEEEEKTAEDEGSVSQLTRGDTKDEISTARGWYSALMNLTEEELYPRIGLDGIMYLRLLDIGLQVSTVLLVTLALPLLIIYVTVHNWDAANDDKKVETWVECIAIDGIPAGSLYMLAPVVASIFLTAVVITVLTKHHRDMIQWRLNSLTWEPPEVQDYSTLMREIPRKRRKKVTEAIQGNILAPVDPSESDENTQVEASSSYNHFLEMVQWEAIQDACTFFTKNLKLLYVVTVSGERGEANPEEVKAFIRKNYVGAEAAVLMVPQTVRLEQLVVKRDLIGKVIKGKISEGRLEVVWKEAGIPEDHPFSPRSPLRRKSLSDSGSVSPSGADDTLDALMEQDLQMEYDLLNEDIVALRAQLAASPSSAAFVMFQNVRSAAVCSHVLHTMDANHWQVEKAPHPADIDWRTLNMNPVQRYARSLITPVIMFVIYVGFLVPVTLVAGMSTVDNLEELCPWLEPLVEIPVIKDFLQGYLPGLSLTLALLGVPHIFKMLAVYRGLHTYNLQISEAITATFMLFVIDVLLGASFIQSLFNNMYDLLNEFSMSRLFRSIGYSIPDGGFFFVVLICAKMGFSVSIELMQITKMLQWVLHFETLEPKDTAKPPFMTNMPWMLFVFLLCVVYTIVAPLLVPFAVCYFALHKFLWRNQLLYTYTKVVDTKGALWPYIMRVLIYSLILAQVFIAGVLLTKSQAVLVGLELVLAFGTYLYAKSIEGSYRGFMELPLQVAAKMDDLHSERDASTLNHDILAFENPWMHDREKGDETLDTVYGSTGQFEVTPLTDPPNENKV